MRLRDLRESAGGIRCDDVPHCALTNALALGEAVAAPIRSVSHEGYRPAVEGYEPLYELGRGSMGVVWLARDIALGRLVALKLIAAGADPRFGPRLLREGRAIRPAPASAHRRRACPGRGRRNDLPAMDFLEGGDLQTHLQTNRSRPVRRPRWFARWPMR